MVMTSFPHSLRVPGEGRTIITLGLIMAATATVNNAVAPYIA